MSDLDKNNNLKNYDLVIVGGGMVGISLALLLAQQQSGWKVLLLEAQTYDDSDKQNNHPSFDSRSTALSWSSRKIFQGAGLWSELESHTSAIKKIHVSDRGHMGLTRISADEAGVEALGYVIENRWIGAVLLDKLAATSVEMMAPERVKKIIPLKSGVRIELENSGEPVQASLLVIADGANSKTAQKLGIHSDRQPYGQQGIIANIALQDAHNGVAYERFTDAGPLALLPLSDNRYSLVWSVRNDELSTLMALDDAGFLSALQKAFGYRAGIFKKVGKRYSYPLKLIASDKPLSHRGVALGNAAHCLHPVMGQGFNLGMRDLTVLASVIADLDDTKQLGDYAMLARYWEARKKDHQRTINMTDSIVHIFSNSHFPFAVGRTIALQAMSLFPSLTTPIVKQAKGQFNLLTQEERS